MKLKSTYSQTRLSQFRTLCGVSLIVLAGLLALGRISVAGSQRDVAGLLVFVDQMKWQAEANGLAQELQRYFRRHSIELTVVGPQRESSRQSIHLLRPQSAPQELKAAWDAYYQLQFSKALRIVERAKQGEHRQGARLAANVLAALIQQARGQQKAVRRIMQQLHFEWPQLQLPADIYPPAFIQLFGGARRVGIPAPPESHQVLASIHKQAIAYARRQGWRQLWALRVSAVGWNARLELHRFPFSRKSRSQTVVIEFERGASLREIAAQLGKKIFLQ